MKQRRPAIFLDRDGTIIHDRHYLKDPKDIRYYKGSLGALKQLQDGGYVTVIVTNQSGIGRGLFDHVDLKRVHNQLLKDLRGRGIRLGGFYICPHHPDRRCRCRKPQTLLYRRAARQLNLDLRNSYLIGDRLSDVEAAPGLKARGILIRTGQHRSQRLTRSHTRKYAVEKTLASAARRILKGDAHAVHQ